MFRLNAIGAQGGDRWTKSITPGTVIRLGRAPEKGWSVPWDMRISREHCEIELKNDRLYVRCLEKARNPIYRLGETVKEFTLFPGESFRIGLTTFQLESTEGEPGSDYDFEVSKEAQKAQQPQPPEEAREAGEAGMEETDRVDDEVERLREEIASLRAQLQADVEAKRAAARPGKMADQELDTLRRQVIAFKKELMAAQEEVERLRKVADRNVSDSKEFKALRANVEEMKDKVESGEFLPLSGEEAAEPDLTKTEKKTPKGLEALRARLAREANARRNRRST